MNSRQALVLPLAVLLFAVPAKAAPDIYPVPEQSKADSAAALQTASTTHRRVILDFGGNWCPDCRVLDTFFQDATNRHLLDADYVLVHVNIGRMNRNLDIAEHYVVP